MNGKTEVKTMSELEEVKERMADLSNFHTATFLVLAGLGCLILFYVTGSVFSVFIGGLCSVAGTCVGLCIIFKSIRRWKR